MSLSLRNSATQKTVFLDRDGVINQDSKFYIKSWSEFAFLPRSLLALKKLSQHHFHTYIITNQSAINRNMVPLSTLNQIHNNMLAEINSAGGRIEEIFFCPHRPEEHCSCRKPKPGLVLAARKKYHMDLSCSYLVGDSAKDIMCAKQAGCGFSLLVKTGNYSDAVRALSGAGMAPDYDALDLYDAVKWIIAHHDQNNRSETVDSAY